MTTWFIDAIDLRAGFAAATRREPDLLLNVAFTENSPTVFIGPPSFEPQFVGTRSMGFGLARNRGQLGLFHENSEIPFDSLVSLAEFVRRVYLRGAAGDGPGENGGTAPPTPPPQDNEPEWNQVVEDDLQQRAEDYPDSVAALMAFVDENSIAIKSLNFGKSKTCQSLAQLGSQQRTRGQPQYKSLVRGALRVLRETYRRRPNIADKEHFLHWLMTLQRLASMVTRMGLWPLMREEFVDWQRPATWVYGQLDHEPFDGLEYLVRELLRHDAPAYILRQCCLWTDTDPFDALAIFPVPPHIVRFGRHDGKNLQSFLSASIATPFHFSASGNSRWRREWAELTLFAAACINLGADCSPTISGKDVPINILFIDQLATRTQSWLGENLPRFVYASEIERVIEQASEIST